MKKLTVLTLAIIFSMTFTLFFPSSMAAGAGPVASWRFDEETGAIAEDSSGNGNTGTLVGGAQWVKGVSGNAVDLDGISGSVSVGSSSTVNVQGNQFSLECWIRPTLTIDGSLNHIINVIDKGDEYGFQINPGDARLWFFVWVDGNPWAGIRTTTSVWTSDTWYHLAGIYDGSSLKIYVNGVLENIRPLSGSLSVGGNPLSIGSYTFGTMNFFNGAIDEVNIYNYARTAEEIWNDANIVTSPTQAISLIVQNVRLMNLQQGIVNSFDTKLQNALESLNALNADHRSDALNKLQAFINSVEAQRNTKLTNEQANQLVMETQNAINLIQR